MADHVGVGEVADHDVVLRRVDVGDERVGDALRAHLGHQIVGRHLLRRDQDAVLAGIRLLASAVEEVRDVRVLLGFGEPQVGAAAGGEDVGEVARQVCGSNTTGKPNVRSYTVIVVQWTIGRGRTIEAVEVVERDRARDLARAVRAEVEEDDRVAVADRPDRAPSASTMTTGLMNSSVTPAACDAATASSGAARVRPRTPPTIASYASLVRSHRLSRSIA